MFGVGKFELIGNLVDRFSAGHKHFFDEFDSKSVDFLLDRFLEFKLEPVLQFSPRNSGCAYNICYLNGLLVMIPDESYCGGQFRILYGDDVGRLACEDFDRNDVKGGIFSVLHHKLVEMLGCLKAGVLEIQCDT